jgi:hypothetical protein
MNRMSVEVGYWKAKANADGLADLFPETGQPFILTGYTASLHQIIHRVPLVRCSTLVARLSDCTFPSF